MSEFPEVPSPSKAPEVPPDPHHELGRLSKPEVRPPQEKPKPSLPVGPEKKEGPKRTLNLPLPPAKKPELEAPTKPDAAPPRESQQPDVPSPRIDPQPRHETTPQPKRELDRSQD